MTPNQKETFYSNLDFFLKKRNIKKTDLEKEAGVSQGYLSRFLQKDDPDSFPSVSFLEYCSRKFELTMDDLINVRFEDMSSTEESIYKFIRKLIDETREDDLQWVEHDQWRIRTYIKEGNGEWNEFALDPIKRPHEDGMLDDEVVFDPAKDINGDGTLDGSMYETMIDDHTRVFLLPISSWDDLFENVDEELTLWLEDKGKPHPKNRECIVRCGQWKYKSFLPILKELQEVIKDRQNHIQISKDFKDIINSYLYSDPDESAPGVYNIQLEDYD